MPPEVIGLIGFLVMLLMIFLGIWVGTSMAIVGFCGLIYLQGFKMAFAFLGNEPFSQISSYVLACVPLYILMGIVVSKTGIASDLHNTANKWIGHVKGGLAIATMFASGAFAAICGSSDASAATIGRVAYPEMLRYRYDKRLASACIAAGGTIGILIPPSLGFILYGLLTEQSIGKLYMAGFLPGVLQVLFYSITIYILCKLKPELGPAARKAPFKERFHSLKGTWSMLTLFVITIGGIYAGVFTPTEAGAVGAFGAALLSILKGTFKKSTFVDAVKDTVQITAMIILLITGAFMFMRFLAVNRLPTMVYNLIISLQIPKTTLLALILMFYVLLGCFWDIYAVMLLTLPIIFPIVEASGFDPIWFGVLMVRCIEIGLITPPFSLNVFVLSSSINEEVKTIYKGIWPFILADGLHLLLLTLFPQISLFLPNVTR